MIFVSVLEAAIRTHGDEHDDHLVAAEKMNGKNSIGDGSREAKDLLGTEQTKQDTRENKESNASTVPPGPKDAAKVHRHHDTEERAAGQ